MQLKISVLLAMHALVTGSLALAQDSPSPPVNYPARYMGADAPLGTAPNGAVVYNRVLEAAPDVFYLEPTVKEVTDGVWIIGGYALINCVVIEAPDGLIVYDTGDNAETGKLFRELIQTKISKKPIKAIIYSHSHYALGTGPLVDDPKTVEIIGHPKLNETVEANLRGGGAPSAIPELGPVLTARAAVQFNNFLPTTGPDAGLAPGLTVKELSFLPATRTVEDGQTLTVAGLELQFFTKYISDDHSLTVWIPSKKAVLNNFFWPGTPNLYTLRGAVHRDPTEWRNGLRVIRDLQPEHLLSTHTVALSGKERVFDILVNYMDLISLTYDQSLRGILRGLGPDDLRYFIYKPKHLASPSYNAETYGETTWFPPSTFLFQMGWFDRDTTKIFQLPPRDEAERLVALMGGKAKVVEQARLALEKKEYAWAAQLVNYVYLLDPTDREARQIKADSLRKLGQLAFGSIGRAFLLSEARALEGREQIPRLIPPPTQIIAGAPSTFVDYYRVRIDPRKAEDVDKVVTFTFGDTTVGLHVRRGVAEFLPEPAKYFRPADLALSMDGPTWARLYLNQSAIGDEIKSGKVKVTHGDAAAAERVMGLFDRFEPARNVTIPPLHD
jgi:alkyl sulfatase BDS1-like metallo-beta-lactamase superfamily hydrolase